MTSRSTTRSRRLLAGVFGFALVVAACGSDDGGSSDDTSAATDAPADSEAPADTEAPAETDAPADTEAPAESEAPADTEAPAETDGADGGEDAGDMEMGPATGEPIKIGVQNLEGDPAGSFPEFSVSIQAAADYANEELGGLGGRPIEIVLCKSVVTPDDSQRCANELSAEGVELVFTTIAFFGNQYSIYQGSDIPVVSITPVTIADFTTPGVYAIGAGGGCLGVHTGLAQIASDEIEELEGIEVTKVGIPWADTPPGVVCYNDLEAKPLDVINGTEPGDSARAGERPDLEYLGVPVAPASPDVTPQATEILDYEPDVIIYSAQGADCWNFVDALGRLGWTPDQIPLILSGACTDFTAMAAAGDLAVGIYLTGTEKGLLVPLDSVEGEHLEEATIYQTKGLEYGMTEDDLFKGFAGQGFSAVMNLWEVSKTIDGDVTGQSLGDALAATDGSVSAFGGSPLNCAGAPEPYVSVCGSAINLSVWDGTQLVEVIPRLNALDLVAGTELRPG
jgi:branched-chain amino acid transport system substrate-binding protein